MIATSTVIINNLKITQRIIGEGLPLLALHGWGANSSLVMPLAEKLAPLGYRVYVPDLPGFGESDLPPAAWSVNDYVKFVLAYMDAHELERAHLFGHSFGGRLGLVLGAEHSPRFIKMVLADSAGIRGQASLIGRVRQTTYRAARSGLQALRLNSLADDLGSWYRDRYASNDYKNAGPLRETFVKVVNEDLLPYAARVSVSTLLLWGDQDMDTPLWHGQLLEKTIPDAGLVVFEGAGHYSYLDRLHDSVRIVDHFFKH
ncbi:MAG: alpha/beta hydrolase [Burkholderiales bacterium]|nr:alpha/beta hydrolase [Anaerolineae bacterium]